MKRYEVDIDCGGGYILVVTDNESKVILTDVKSRGYSEYKGYTEPELGSVFNPSDWNNVNETPLTEEDKEGIREFIKLCD